MIEFNPGDTVGICDSCGTKQTLPRLDDDRRVNLYDRANHFRRNNEFDKAAGIYEQILNEDNTDSEAYWSLVLCRYGIEYVEDPATHKRVPTVNRAQFTSIFDDDNYKSALQYADSSQRAIYESEANTINEIQKGILAISQKEEPFDVFICYKETDQNGRRTMDSVLANDLYYQLKNEGFKVFFSRITLEDKLGSAYEPYIFAALNSAKVMVVLGTKPEYFNAVWVKNEWSRYLSLVKQSQGKKVLIPAYRDMDPYDLPEEFSHLQAQDMSKLGFMQDLIRGIKKITNADGPKQVQKETVVINNNNANTAPLLRRAFLFLEDGDWEKADDFCEQVLNLDPENAQAYLGKLMAELRARRQEDLANCEEPFDENSNYHKVVRFGGDKIAQVLSGYIEHIKERNENARLTGIYNTAVSAMNSANSEASFKRVAECFRKIPGYKDADVLAEECFERAEISRKDAIYDSAKSKMSNRIIEDNESAIKLFSTISDWRDSNELISICQRTIEEIKAKAEAGRLEKERLAELARIEAEEQSKRRRRTIAIVLSIVVAVVAVAIFVTTVIIPKQRYDKAVALINSGDYESAHELLAGLNYKDSNTILDSIKPQYNKIMISKGQVGSSIYFGSYEQDNDTTNGSENIEWLILAKEVNRILVISKYALDYQPYNTIDRNVTWEICSLRKWLNETFINTAFNLEEQNRIIITNVTADRNPSWNTSPGENTTDKVFLLSITEVNKYFSSDEARQCEETIYCHAQGKNTDRQCWWWLRSPGNSPRNAASVNHHGSVRDDGTDVANEYVPVRPALWINLES